MKDVTPDMKPFPSYKLQNNNQNINRVKERLEELKKAKSLENSEESYDAFKVVRNYDIMRLQLVFDNKPDEKMRSILKHNGFRWSPKNGAWQRQLSGNAEYSLKTVAKELDAQEKVNEGKEVMVRKEKAEKLVEQVMQTSKEIMQEDEFELEP